jgi:dephospho-CoA kinase
MNGTNMENSDIILVTGYAGSGKSTYCEILEKEHGYYYLSHDKWMHKQQERNRTKIAQSLSDCILRKKQGLVILIIICNRTLL